MRFFAPCTRGAERILAAELKSIGMREVRQVTAGASCEGALIDAYRVLMWSRVASRFMLTLAEVDASSAETLYEAARAISWEDHVTATGTIAVDASGMNAGLRNTQFTAVKVKDAIADRFRDLAGVRPSVDPKEPDLRVNVAVRGPRAVISIDLAGEPLHRRGYRRAGEQVAAPLKETLAAAVLSFAGWHGIAGRGGAFVDPLCGSGTLAIEAAMIAGDIAPGFLRRRWGFSGWLGHEAGTWTDVREEAADRREAGLSKLPTMYASDVDPRAIEISRGCALRAGLEGHIRFQVASLERLKAPEGARDGLLVTNPPWGERLSDRAALPALYATLSQRLTEEFHGWKLAVITPDERIDGALGLQPNRTLELASGPKLTTVRVYDVGTPKPELIPPRDEQAQAFANRLAKMAKHHGKWAHRANVTCYRIYDADLPDYAVVVDRYEGAGPDAGKVWAHIAEYAAPAEIDPKRAEQRIEDVLDIVPEVLGIEPGNVFMKRRERQRGESQYERSATRGATGLVAENGLLFEVNLSDYLDTGLFLDHRDTRAWLRELADGTRFLNLFAYTGTATVYAAAGGAVRTTTVDLSSTYLDWAERNMRHNGLVGRQHERVRADVMEWLDAPKTKGPFDLIFCDPPTFSASKRMSETFDVQRDHVRLIGSAAKLLSEKGTIVFSVNRKRFVLDTDALAGIGLSVRDVTARTIPKDFERTPKVHQCWQITRASR